MDVQEPTTVSTPNPSGTQPHPNDIDDCGCINALGDNARCPLCDGELFVIGKELACKECNLWMDFP